MHKFAKNWSSGVRATRRCPYLTNIATDSRSDLPSLEPTWNPRACTICDALSLGMSPRTIGSRTAGQSEIAEISTHFSSYSLPTQTLAYSTWYGGSVPLPFADQRSAAADQSPAGATAAAYFPLTQSGWRFGRSIKTAIANRLYPSLGKSRLSRRRCSSWFHPGRRFLP